MPDNDDEPLLPDIFGRRVELPGGGHADMLRSPGDAEQAGDDEDRQRRDEGSGQSSKSHDDEA